MSFWNWFKTKKQLVRQLDAAGHIVTGLNEALKYSYFQTENLQHNIYSLLGAVALQADGEFVVKSEFVKMMNNPDSGLEVVVTNNESGLVIAIKEVVKDEHS